MAEDVSTFRLYLMRTGYLVNFTLVGLGAWPALVSHTGSWDPVRGAAFSLVDRSCDPYLARAARRYQGDGCRSHHGSHRDPVALRFRTLREGAWRSMERPHPSDLP